MSHARVISSSFRAAVAVAVTWALTFGLVVSGSASMRNFSNGISRSGAQAMNIAAETGAFACVRHTAADATKDSSSPGDNGRRGHNCPDCCLAAHAAAAVLPERIATAMRPVAVADRPVHYAAALAQEPESLLSRSVNGARAPPSLLQNS